MNDIVLVNKPKGITSHDVVNRVRRITGEKRVGHAGTLDPLADGLLILLIGREATKRQSEFLGLDKEYIAEITFGQTSETYDAKGPLSKPVDTSSLIRARVKTALKTFTGEIEQTPPLHSAIHVGGKKLYQLAHKGWGADVTIPKRRVTIFEAKILSFTPASTKPAIAKIKFHVSKGTYIRSLAHDLGRELGVGAYLSGLTRTRIGDFLLEDAMTLEQFEKQS